MRQYRFIISLLMRCAAACSTIAQLGPGLCRLVHGARTLVVPHLNSALTSMASAFWSSTAHSLADFPSAEGSPHTVNGRVTKSGRVAREGMNLIGGAGGGR